jgi:ATP-dependent DNA helicase RecG
MFAKLTSIPFHCVNLFGNLEQTFAIFTHLLNIMSDILDKEIKYLKGVGPKRAEMLAKELGILTCRDILYYFPFKYIDRSRIYKINEIDTTQTFIQAKGKITHFRMEGQRYKQRLVGIFTDGSGILELVWFKGLQWVMSNYQLNTEYIAFGRPGIFNNKLSIAHPELERTDTPAATVQPH